MSEDGMVQKLRATLALRNEADAKTAQADTEEAALNAVIEENGWDADELMRKAYGL